LLLDLIKSFGKPIVSTSANISDAPIPESFDEIDPHILAQVDEVVPLNKEKVARIPSQVLQIMPDGSVKQLR
jgi:L-threonylcarbamoyladenylate synthase